MSRRWKLLLLMVAILASAVVGRTLLSDRFSPTALIGTLRELGDSPLAIPLYVLAFGLATSAFMPGVALMVTAGVTWGFWPGWVVVWLSANVWANAHFVIGRWFAGDLVREWLTKRGAGWLLRELDHGGVLTTIMIRQLPLPYSMVNLSAGASPMPWGRWVVGNAIGLIPNCLIYTQLAAALADGVDGARQTAAVRVVVTATVVIGFSLLTRWVQRRRQLNGS